MTENRPMTAVGPWRVTIPFSVPNGDLEGDLTELLFDAALCIAPEGALGMAARADTAEGKVWIVFTLDNVTGWNAKQIAREVRERVSADVLGGDSVNVDYALA